MLIPLIPKDPERNDFTCRDGEIEWIMDDGHWLRPSLSESDLQAEGLTGEYCNIKMTALHDYPTANIRIPLESGDKAKAELMLSGQISRVDPVTVERLTLAITQRAAETMLEISTDLRRQGLFILPFRVYAMLQTPDGNLSFPSPQAVALPTDFPSHPEITAASTTDDCLTLALRFPVRPHRLVVTPPDNLPDGYSLRTFISYPLYIPDPKEMRGSIGSVRSATGGNATGVRFAFLSSSAIKASVAAPEKYYEMVGNERTGYRISSKAAQTPDYSCYATATGVPPFPASSLLALGESVSEDTDPLDWIADWVAAYCINNQEGFLPVSLPHKFWHSGGSGSSVGADLSDWSDLDMLLGRLDGIEAEFIRETAESLGTPCVLLTRPMTFADAETSRRHASPTAIRTLRVIGLPPDAPAQAVLFGSDDCVRWTALRRFAPRIHSAVVTPLRLFWRLLLFYSSARSAPLLLRVSLKG